MSFVAEPLRAARGVQHEHEAAQLRDELESELAMNPNTPAGWDGDAQKGLDVLNERFDLAHVPFGEDRELGPRARRYKRSGKARTRYGQNKVPRRPSTESDAAGGGWLEAAGSLVPSPGRRTRRAFEQTGLPGQGRQLTSITLEAIGLIIGLGLLYLIVNESGPGPGAFSKILDGFGIGIDAIVRDVDPLGGVDAIRTARASDARKKIAAKPVAAAASQAADIGAVIAPGSAAPAGLTAGALIAAPRRRAGSSARSHPHRLMTTSTPE